MGMVALKCPQCGADVELDETREFGFCTFCGTKVVQEKVVVEHKGSVKVDVTEELENLYQIARRSIDNGDSENAARYYDMILVKDPNSWEAMFYLVYCQAMNCKIAQITSAANSISNCLGSVMDLVKENVIQDEQINVVQEIINRCIYSSELLENAAENHYKEIDISIRSKYDDEWLQRKRAARMILNNLGDSIFSTFYDNDDIKKLAFDPWKMYSTEYGFEIEKEPIYDKMAQIDAEYVKELYARKIKSSEFFFNNSNKRKQRKVAFIAGIIITVLGAIFTFLGALLYGIIMLCVGIVLILIGKKESKKKFEQRTKSEMAYIERLKSKYNELDSM